MLLILTEMIQDLDYLVVVCKMVSFGAGNTGQKVNALKWLFIPKGLRS